MIYISEIRVLRGVLNYITPLFIFCLMQGFEYQVSENDQNHYHQKEIFPGADRQKDKDRNANQYKIAGNLCQQPAIPSLCFLAYLQPQPMNHIKHPASAYQADQRFRQ
jgi:hypothetical protein